MEKKIENRTGSTIIESDLCYPSSEKYRWLCKIDATFVKEELFRWFGAKRISNKYAILMPDGQIWYQHDKDTWLIEYKNLQSDERKN